MQAMALASIEISVNCCGFSELNVCWLSIRAFVVNYQKCIQSRGADLRLRLQGPYSKASMTISWTKTIAQFKGRWCTAGVDLSSVLDLTCCVYLFPYDDDRERVDVLMQTFCPKERLYDKKNKYKEQYQSWEKQGYLTTTPDNAVDYDIVRKSIVENNKVFKIGLIGIDAQFQGIEFAMQLEKDLGHTEKRPVVITCTNTAKKMGPICQEFERRLLKKKLNHGGNPILRFMADCVTVRAADVDGNIKPDKDKSQGKIDGIVAMLYALDRLLRSSPPRKIKLPMAI